MKRWCTYAVLPVALAGCASVDDQRANLQRHVGCCASLKEASPVALEQGKQLIEITSSDPVFSFVEGKSRFKLLALPSAAAGKQLRVTAIGRTLAVYTGGKSWGPYFHPAVTFLDEKLAVVRAHSASLEPTRPDTCGPHFGCGIVTVSASVPESARYVALHQPLEMLGRTSEQVGVGTTAAQTLSTGAALIQVPGGAQPGRRIIAMETGQLEVMLLP